MTLLYPFIVTNMAGQSGSEQKKNKNTVKSFDPADVQALGAKTDLIQESRRSVEETFKWTNFA